jgi:hypothetical protein
MEKSMIKQGHKITKRAIILKTHQKHKLNKRVDISNLGCSLTPDSSSSQLFQNNSSFQNFSLLQFSNIIENKEFGILSQMREAIKYKQKIERKIIEKMKQNEKYSPRTINHRKSEMEKWVSIEKEKLTKTK